MSNLGCRYSIRSRCTILDGCNDGEQESWRCSGELRDIICLPFPSHDDDEAYGKIKSIVGHLLLLDICLPDHRNGKQALLCYFLHSMRWFRFNH